MLTGVQKLPRDRSTTGAMNDRRNDVGNRADSAAALWPPLKPYIAAEARLGRIMARRRWTAALYEVLRFGVKQGWACLFGGIAVALMIGSFSFYPAGAPL